MALSLKSFLDMYNLLVICFGSMLIRVGNESNPLH